MIPNPTKQQEIQDFIDRLSAQIEQKLPGQNGQYEMAPAERKRLSKEWIQKRNPKIASVLCHIYPLEDSWRLLMMKRRSYPGVHSDQISFPGGKKEESDQDNLDTALRETQEEMGFSIKRDQIIGPLSDLYIPPSNFQVFPFLSIDAHAPQIVPEEAEVDEVIQAHLSPFLDGSIRTKQLIKTSYGEFEVPVYQYENHTIWGATAMMISELCQLIKESS